MNHKRPKKSQQAHPEDLFRINKWQLTKTLLKNVHQEILTDKDLYSRSTSFGKNL